LPAVRAGRRGSVVVKFGAEAYILAPAARVQQHQLRNVQADLRATTMLPTSAIAVALVPAVEHLMQIIIRLVRFHVELDFLLAINDQSAVGFEVRAVCIELDADEVFPASEPIQAVVPLGIRLDAVPDVGESTVAAHKLEEHVRIRERVSIRRNLAQDMGAALKLCGEGLFHGNVWNLVQYETTALHS
jgi:hypothetical protein